MGTTDQKGHGMTVETSPHDYLMRNPCRRCEHEYGRVERKATQDCIYCLQCGKFCYNAPRSETGNPVAHLKSRHNVSSSQRSRILTRDNHRCVFCGANGDTAELHVGHLISVENHESLGLTERDLQSDDNLAASCATCNLGLGKNSVSARLLAALVHRRELHPDPITGERDAGQAAALLNMESTVSAQRTRSPEEYIP